jgi:hypothetical protein
VMSRKKCAAKLNRHALNRRMTWFYELVRPDA